MNDLKLTVCNVLTSLDDYCTFEKALLCGFCMKMSEYNQHVCADSGDTCCERIYNRYFDIY